MINLLSVQAIAMKKLDEITSQLRLPAQRVDDVKYMVEKITQGQLGIGRWFDILVGACVYVTVRQHHLPLTIIEVAVCFEHSGSYVKNAYQFLLLLSLSLQYFCHGSLHIYGQFSLNSVDVSNGL